MKIIVSVHELSTETQPIIDNMRRSGAPVLIGDPTKPMAVLLSLEEYEHLLREAQKSAAPNATQPIAKPAAPPKPSAADTNTATKEPAPAEAVPAAQHGGIARRTADAIQADRSAEPEPQVVSQRPTAAPPGSTSAADRLSSLRSPRLTRPLPKPPRPLKPPRARMQLSLAAVPGGWQTIALVVGMLVMGVVGFALIVRALGG